MRFWERNAIWFVLGFVTCLFFIVYEGTLDKPGNAPHLLLWALIRSVSLALSARAMFGFAVKQSQKFAVWGPLVCRWFAHICLAVLVGFAVVSTTFTFAYGFADGSATHVASRTVKIVTGAFFAINGIVTCSLAGYLARLVWLDVVKVRACKMQSLV